MLISDLWSNAAPDVAWLTEQLALDGRVVRHTPVSKRWVKTSAERQGLMLSLRGQLAEIGPWPRARVLHPAPSKG